MDAPPFPMPSGETCTRAAYAALPEDLPVRVSLVHGQLVVSPRPRPIHQRIARRLATRIEDAAPDIVVYSATHDVYERPIPADLVTLVAEVVSPSTMRKSGGSSRPCTRRHASGSPQPTPSPST